MVPLLDWIDAPLKRRTTAERCDTWPLEDAGLHWQHKRPGRDCTGARASTRYSITFVAWRRTTGGIVIPGPASQKRTLTLPTMNGPSSTSIRLSWRFPYLSPSK